MSEHETDPQRRPADPGAEPSYPTAQLPRVERGPSDPTASPVSDVPAEAAASTPGPAASPTPDPAVVREPGPTAEPVATPVSEPVPPVAAEPAAAPVSEPTVAVSSVSGPFAAPETRPAGPPVSGYPQPPHPAGQQHPYPGGTWQPGQPGQPGWPTNSGYPGPYGAGQPSAYPGAVPPWAQTPAPAPQPGRVAKFVAAGVVALALMAGSGIAGGAVALALDGDSGGRTFTAAPIINSADLPAIAAKVANSVVSISTGSGEGSGVVLTADGYVLTNNHVVASASGDTVRVFLADGKNIQAKIVGTDPKTDLAVVKTDSVSGLDPATFGDSDGMRVGDTVLALGSPLGLQGSVTAGIISARDRTIQAGSENQPSPQGASSISGLLQTDAPINPGNSGGALINTRGEVIGINTAIATAGQGSGNIGVGFAIPSNKAKNVAEQLQRGEKVSHPSLGVAVNTAENGGALIARVNPDSPAAQAGLREGDVVTRYGDKVISESNDLVAAVQGGRVGDRVELTYVRNGAEAKATVTLAEAS